MTQGTVSPKYQIVIPKEVRRTLPVRKGQKMAVVVKGDLILLVPVLPLKKLRGIAKGMDTEGYREKKDRPL